MADLLKDVPISLEEVLRAEKVVYQHIIPTQLTYYKNLSDLIGANIYIKHENHHPGGSFKIQVFVKMGWEAPLSQ